MTKNNKEELKILAQEFYKTKLWELLSDADIFGVELEDGRIAYCCLMRPAGERVGLGIYLGDKGFKTYLDTITIGVNKDNKLTFERIVTFSYLQLTFDSGKADFLTHRKHKMPEQDNCTEEELDIMRQALAACISLAKFINVAGGDVVAIGFDEYEEYPTKEGGKKIILMKNKGDGYICEYTKSPAYDTSEEQELEEMANKLMETITSMPTFLATQDLRKSGTVQCRLVHYPKFIKDEEDDEGYFAQCLLAINKGNGHILKPVLARANDAKDMQTVLLHLCKYFEDEGHCPLQISVPDLATESVLKAFCKALKIKLVKERRPLHELNEVWDCFFKYVLDM